MKPRVIVQVDSTAEHEREIIQNYVDECMPIVDAYLKKYDDTNDAEVMIEVFVKKNHDASFHGTLHANVDGVSIHFEREKFWQLRDLIHHAFQHMKEQLAAK